MFSPDGEVALHKVTGHLPSPFRSMPEESDAAQHGYGAPSRHREFSLFLRDQFLNLRLGTGRAWWPPPPPRRASARRAWRAPPRRDDRPSSRPTNSRRAMSALRRPSTSRPSTLSWRLVMPQGFCRVRSCAPRGMLRTPLARSLRRTMAAIGAGVEALEDLQGGAQRAFGIAIGQRHGLLVGTADLLPGLRRRLPVAGHLQREGPRDCLPAHRSRRPCRHSQKASSPWIQESACFRPSS